MDQPIRVLTSPPRAEEFAPSATASPYWTNVLTFSVYLPNGVVVTRPEQFAEIERLETLSPPPVATSNPVIPA